MKVEFIAIIVEGVMKLIEKFETSKKFSLLVWMVIGIFAIYAIASLLQGIGAVKWW